MMDFAKEIDMLAELYVTAAKKKRKQKKERQEIARPFPNPIFTNFDYTEEGPNETSPGGGLYHGRMDKYKSVDEFVKKRRKELKERRKQLEARLCGYRMIIAGLGESEPWESSPEESETDWERVLWRYEQELQSKDIDTLMEELAQLRREIDTVKKEIAEEEEIPVEDVWDDHPDLWFFARKGKLLREAIENSGGNPSLYGLK